MNNLNELQQIWKQQPVPFTADPQTMLYKAKENRYQLSNLLRADTLTLVISFPLLCVALFYLNSSSSIIGMCILLLSSCLHIYSRWRQWSLLKHINFTDSPFKLLNDFEQLHQYMKMLYSKGRSIYLSLVFIGTILLFIGIPHFLLTQKLMYMGVLIVSFVFIIIKRTRQMQHERATVDNIIASIKEIKQTIDEV